MKYDALQPKSLPMRLVRIAFGFACVLCGCCFLFVAWQSLLDTCWYVEKELTGFYRTNPAEHLALLVGCALALWAVVHGLHRFRLAHFVLPCVLLCTLLAGCVWIWAANAAQMGESSTCSNVAMGAAQGDWYTFRPGEYMSLFPFQCGFVAYLELIYAVFGQGNTTAASCLGLGWILVGQTALYFLAGRISPHAHAKTLTALLSLLLWPWLLYVTFNYGTLPSLSLSLCACLALLRFLDKAQAAPHQSVVRQLGLCLPTALLFAGAMLFKSSTLIVLLAACLVLVLGAVQQKSWRLLPCVILLCTFALGAPAGVQAWYEARSGFALGGGTPKLVWISMGLEESPTMAMGWYNGKTYSALRDAKLDEQACADRQREDIAARLAVFGNNPAYAHSFFMQKINSQWINPSFGSIDFNQASQLRSTSRWPALTQYVCSRTRNSFVIRLSDALQTLVYCSAALGLFSLTVHRSSAGRVRFGTHANAALLAITALGGFLYLLLSEGKSQYALNYYILLLPYAAHGLCTAWHGALRFWHRGIKKQKHIF